MRRNADRYETPRENPVLPARLADEQAGRRQVRHLRATQRPTRRNTKEGFGIFSRLVSDTSIFSKLFFFRANFKNRRRYASGEDEEISERVVAGAPVTHREPDPHKRERRHHEPCGFSSIILEPKLSRFLHNISLEHFELLKFTCGSSKETCGSSLARETRLSVSRVTRSSWRDLHATTVDSILWNSKLFRILRACRIDWCSRGFGRSMCQTTRGSSEHSA